MNLSNLFPSFRVGIGAKFRAAALPLLVLGAVAASALGEGAKPFRAARLTYMEGEVRVEQAKSTANSPATLNMPLVEGTVLSTGTDGEAEIEFEDGSLVRLTPNSGMSLANLSIDSSGTYQTRIALLGGLTYLELRAGTRYVYSVDAGGDLTSPSENATIRVNFDERPASIAVLDGSAHISAAGGADVDAASGQTVHNDAESAGGVYSVKSGIAPESWDRWNEDRDSAASSEEDSQTAVRQKFAGNQGYGWSDLDVNGSWYDVPGHGQVWQPDLAAAPDDSVAAEDMDAVSQDPNYASGFDPYGFGSWAWTPAGYSWASGYAWGWLPYRCGQWSYFAGFGWGWSPNSFCGLNGFGGYGYSGYGYGLNFGHVPGNYKRPHRPIPGPGPIHPIVHGHGGGGPVPVVPFHRPPTERVIAGITAQPIQPIGSGFVQDSGGVLGAGLRRDYPVDIKTHVPVTGVSATNHEGSAANSNARSAWEPGASTNGQPRLSYPQRPAYPQPSRDQAGRVGTQPVQGGSQPARAYQPGSTPYQPGGTPYQGGFPAPVNRPLQSMPAARPSAPSAPRYSPPAAPAARPAPAAAPSAPKGK